MDLIDTIMAAYMECIFESGWHIKPQPATLRGQSVLDTGYFYCPYIPLTQTPTIIPHTPYDPSLKWYQLVCPSLGELSVNFHGEYVKMEWDDDTNTAPRVLKVLYCDPSSLDKIDEFFDRKIHHRPLSTGAIA